MIKLTVHSGEEQLFRQDTCLYIAYQTKMSFENGSMNGLSWSPKSISMQKKLNTAVSIAVFSFATI